MVLWKFIRREIRNRPGRATLTLLSIVIGVAAVVSVEVSIATTRQAYQEMNESLTGRAALEVVAEGGGLFGMDAVPLVAQTPGVQAALPLLQQPTYLRNKDTRPLLLVIGADLTKDDALRDYELKEGSLPSGEGALMEAGFAHGLGLHVGDEINLFCLGIQKVPIVGLLSPRSAAGFNPGGIVVLPLPVAQHFFHKPKSITSISILLKPSTDARKVMAEIARRLPPGLAVHPPAGGSQLASETLKKVEQGLNFSYVLTLALAIFMIVNTFLINVGERRRQLAILRAIGTTRLQIIGMLLFEGLMMGVVGTLLGSLVGLGGAYLLASTMSKAMGAAVPAVHLSAGPFIIAAIVGPGMSLLAMLVPAYIAGKVPPLEGMRPAVAEPDARVSVRMALLGIAVFLITGALLAACFTGYLPEGLSPYTGVAFTMAFVGLIPPVLGLLSGLIGGVLRPLLGTEARIARRQVLRRRARTTLTIGVLYISVASGIGIGTAIIDQVQDVRSWQERTIVGDFFVRATFTDPATGKTVPMPESLEPQIRAIPGVEELDTLRWTKARAEDQDLLLVVREFSDPKNLPLYMASGDKADVRQRLFAGEAVIGSVLAKRLGKGVGDEIAIESKHGPRKVRIAGILTDYMGGGMVVHMERQSAKRLLDIEGFDIFMIKARSQTMADVGAALKTLCEQQGLLLHSFPDLRQRLDALMNGVIASLWALMGLGLIVSAFGVANTLTMNVLEQTRELALLRVVAMSRGQVRKTILGQAAIIGGIGLTTGTVGGMVGAYVTNIGSAILSGQAVQFALHPSLLVGSFVAGLVIVLAAAWLPAERAARLNLLIALQYE